jgi:hypothetical protein
MRYSYGKFIIGVGEELRSDSPLENSQIMDVAPSVFAETQHESRSERYTYIPTVQIIEALRKEGFFPYSVIQGKSRIPGKTEFTKHMVKFRKKDHIMASLGQEIGEIVLINSHDGTSSYQMIPGIFRLVCTNGLVVGNSYETHKVLHRGDIKNNVIEAAYEIVNELKDIGDNIDEMKATRLNSEEKEAFAKSALVLKYEPDEAPINPSRLLTERRYDDKGDDLWKTFNTVQENMVKGGLSGINKNFNRITTRPVKSVDGNVRLNRALWTLADEMAKIKQN